MAEEAKTTETNKEAKTTAKVTETKQEAAKTTKAKTTKAKTTKAKASKMKPIKVRFLKSPTGICGLAYNVGDIATISGEQAEELFEIGYAKKA